MAKSHPELLSPPVRFTCGTLRRPRKFHTGLAVAKSHRLPSVHIHTADRPEAGLPTGYGLYTLRWLRKFHTGLAVAKSHPELLSPPVRFTCGTLRWLRQFHTGLAVAESHRLPSVYARTGRPGRTKAADQEAGCTVEHEGGEVESSRPSPVAKCLTRSRGPLDCRPAVLPAYR